MFEKVSRSLKYDSNIFSSTNIYMDTTTDHFTPLTLRVRCNKDAKRQYYVENKDDKRLYYEENRFYKAVL